MIIFLISHRNHVVTPHLNSLGETVQIKGHNIWFFFTEFTKLSLIINKYRYSFLSRALADVTVTYPILLYRPVITRGPRGPESLT